MKPKFTLRDLFWFALVVECAVGWVTDTTTKRRLYAQGLQQCNETIERLVKERDKLKHDLDTIYFMHDGY